MTVSGWGGHGVIDLPPNGFLLELCNRDSQGMAVKQTNV